MRKQNPLKRVIHQTNLNMVTQFCCMFDAMFPILKSSSIATTTAGGAGGRASVISSKSAASISMTRTTSTSIDDDAIIECGFIDVKIQNVFQILVLDSCVQQLTCDCGFSSAPCVVSEICISCSLNVVW